MEDFTKVLELAREVWQSLQDKPARKIAANVLIVSSALCLLCRIPALSSILGSMNETIRGWAFLALIVSVLWISSSFLVDWIYDVVDRRKAEKKQEWERSQREADAEKERARLRAEIRSMSESERRILSLVESGKGCAVWVSIDDAAVQTLLHKGLLKRVGNAKRWQDWENGEDGRAWCILSEIPAEVKECLKW